MSDKFVEGDWDNLTIQYGRSAGRVHQNWRNQYHFSASLEDGAYASIPKATFDRLVSEGRINQDGTIPCPACDGSGIQKGR